MSSLSSQADGATALEAKVDLFFRLHILPHFLPEKAHWWFSLSGGKDSFAMAEAVRSWYLRKDIPFSASVFVINQWGSATQKIAQQIQWQNLIVLDGRALTQKKTGYQSGQQAPCRSCSDARRDITDILLEANPKAVGRANLVARGLHLSDTATSLLWRYAIGRDPAADLIRLGKARPIAPLPRGGYLVKPLAYAREFESAQYADTRGFQTSCCGCPACQFPSRRDIVEETLHGFYDGPLWEFDIPGLRSLLAGFGATGVEELSAGGTLSKHRHLPPDFAHFAVDRFRSRAIDSHREWSKCCDPSMDLDKIGAARLRRNVPLIDAGNLPLPAILSGRPLSALEEWMVATMGPFWGAIGLSPELAAKAWQLQHALFGFQPDELWTQVNTLLQDFYRGRLVGKAEHPIQFTRSIERLLLLR